MTDVKLLHAQGIAVATVDPHTTWRPVCSIPAASFGDGSEAPTYLILVAGFFRHASSASVAQVRTTWGGVELPDSYQAFEVTASVQETAFGWLDTIAFGAGGAADLVLEISSSGTAEVHVPWASIVAIRVDPDLVLDALYHEVDVDYTTTATFTDQAAITLPGNGSDTWLVLGFGHQTPGSSSSNYRMRLNDSVDGVLTTIDVEGEDIAQDRRGHLLLAAYTPTSGSRTVSMQFAHESVAGTITRSAIAAIRLNALAQHAVNRDVSQQALAAAPSWTTTATIAPVPAVTGTWLIAGYYAAAVGTLTDSWATRLQVDDDGGGLADSPAYANTSPAQNSWDPTDITPALIWTVLPLTSGATRTANLDLQMLAGTTMRAQDRTLVGFSVALPGGGPVYVDLGAAAAGSSSVTAALHPLRDLAAAVAGQATVTADAAMIRDLAAAFAGQCDVTADAAVLWDLAAQTAGATTVTADTAVLRNLAAQTAGATTVTADLETIGKIDLAASIAGSTVFAADVAVLRDLTAAVTGNAAFSADLAILRDLTAMLAGAAVVEADLSVLLLTDLATMQADLVVLHLGAVGDVWTWIEPVTEVALAGAVVTRAQTQVEPVTETVCTGEVATDVQMLGRRVTLAAGSVESLR